MAVNDIEWLKRKSGIEDTVRLQDAYEEAEAYILARTRRKRLPETLRMPTRKLALIYLNREGTEGESARSEGGENYTFETVPEEIERVIRDHRLARAGGYTHEYVPAASSGGDEDGQTEEP